MLREITDGIKQAVTFKQFNLQNSFISFKNYDVVFCRYVMIYFSDELRDDIVNKIYGSLNDDGILFTGSYEMFENLSLRFESKLYGNGAYYVKIGAAG